jgi:U3 small nucleolar RNA-associated protein 13
MDGARVDDHDEDDDGLDADAITCFALSGNDELLITVSRNHLLRQYTMNTSSWPESKPAPVEKMWGRTGHSLPVTHMEFHPSNVFLATGSVDGTVRVWDVRGGYVTHVFRPVQGDTGGMHAVSALTWRKDVAQLVIAIGRDDGSICIHDLREEKNVIVLRDHVSAVTCLEWSTQMEDIFVSSGRDAVLNTWQVVKVSPSKKKKKGGEGTKTMYQRVHTLPIYEQVEGMAILHSSDTNLLVATAGSKGVVRLWSADYSPTSISGFKCAAEQSALQAFGADRGGYMGLRYNPRARADSSEGHESIPTGREQLIVPDAEHNLSFLTLSSDKQRPSLAHDRTIVGHNDEILDLKVIPRHDATNESDSEAVTRIAVATNSAQVRLFELGTFSCEVLDGHTATVLCVDVSPCGRYLATCGKDKTMRIWHLGSQRCVAVATGHTEAIGAAALSRKVGKYEVVGKAATNGGGSFAVTASKDRTLKRWNLPGAAELDEHSSAEQSEIALRAFSSVRAHEKVGRTMKCRSHTYYYAMCELTRFLSFS